MTDLSSIKTRQVFLTVPEFSNVPDHPRQRDTERHAKTARDNHLAKASPTQAHVAVASFNGLFWKLDGHTRVYLWNSGELAWPTTQLTATIYECTSYDQVLELYKHFDAQSAAEKMLDKIYGAAREQGIVLNSVLLKTNKYSTALRMAATIAGVGSADPYENTKNFKTEIQILDRINPDQRKFPVGVMAGAFVMLRKDPVKGEEFLKAFNSNAGQKDANSCDAVWALSQVVAGNRNGRSSGEISRDLAGKTLACFDRYLLDQRYVVTPKGVTVRSKSLIDYLKPKPVRKAA
jgi:hypothetical protein